MYNRRFFLTYLIGVFFLVDVNAQINALYQDDYVKDTIFSLENTAYKRSLFCFPGFNVYKEKKKAFDIKQFSIANKNKFRYEIPIRYSSGFSTNDTIQFTARIYTKNVKKILVKVLNSKNMSCDIGGIDITKDGFQWPIEESVSCLKDKSINRILIEVVPNNLNKNIDFYIGSLWIGVYKEIYESSPVNKYLDIKSVIKTISPLAFESYGIYEHYPTEYMHNELLTNVFLAHNGLDKNSAIIKLIRACIVYYPFYNERQLQKQTIQKVFEKEFENYEKLSVCELTKQINYFLVRHFSDPHFRIVNRCTNRKTTRGPIVLYQINNTHKVAAVFDDELRKSIPLGSEIIKINNVSFVKLVDSISSGKINLENTYLKNYRNKKINELLKAEVGNIMELKIKTPDQQITSVRYKLKKRYRISPNFRPKQHEIRELNDHTVYFKINKFFRDTPSEFANNIQKFNSYKSLIIDLRGNGGGESQEAARLLSYFMPADFMFAEMKNRIDQKKDSLVVNVIKRCFKYNLKNKIVVLVDGNTACASELFIEALKNNRKGVLVIGKERTMGALSLVYHVYLKRVRVITNSFTPYIYERTDKIEGKGIIPDILVKINKVEDLKPYKDKVLRKAIDIIKNNNKGSNTNYFNYEKKAIKKRAS